MNFRFGNDAKIRASLIQN